MSRRKIKNGIKQNKINEKQKLNDCLEVEIELGKETLVLLIYASKKSFVNLLGSKKKFYSCVQYNGNTRNIFYHEGQR